MNSMKIQYLERKSEEMHLSGQTAEHRCWHGDYYGGVQKWKGEMK